MSNFTSVCYFPAHCEDCKKLVEVNLLADCTTCPHCGSSRVIPYDHSTLIGEIGTRGVAHWYAGAELGRTPSLTNGTYRCPECKQYLLRFKEIALWD